MTVYLVALLASVVAAWRTWHRLRHFLHVYQREGSTPAAYRAWLDTHRAHHLLGPSHAGGLGLLVGLAMVGTRAPVATSIAAGLAWLVAFGSAARPGARRDETPLDFTEQRRQHASVALVLAAVPVGIGTVLAVSSGRISDGMLALLAGWLAADAGAPLWIWIAGLVSSGDPPADADDEEAAFLEDLDRPWPTPAGGSGDA